MGDKVDLRFYNIKNKSFHPKSYIFEYEEDGDVFIGSSNMFRSALTSGIEWNYRLNKNKNLEDFTFFKNIFEDLAATGIGKTYLAAFDSLDFNRILFVAHREEILIQAELSFKNIRSSIRTGFFSGSNKDSNKEVLFASVQTLGQNSTYVINILKGMNLIIL